MAIWFTSPPEFKTNDRVASLVSHHPPEVLPGTKGTVVAPHIGNLYAVQLPDGKLHRCFAGFELEPINPYLNYCGLLYEGSYARITNTKGHPPEIKAGTKVKIVNALSHASFYDLMLDEKGYHRWLADFELASLSVVEK